VAVILTLVVTAHTFAGQIHTTITDPPPPPIETESQMETGSSEAVDPVTEMAISLLQSVMPLF
jgi:hypothetical protein